jgi:hypothetical protein
MKGDILGNLKPSSRKFWQRAGHGKETPFVVSVKYSARHLPLKRKKGKRS